MTTLSLLKDIKELNSLKARHLPFIHKNEVHKDFDWLRNELDIWSKQFSNHNPKADQIILYFGCYLYNDCESKERLFKILKAQDITLYIDLYLLPAREQRSAQKARNIIDNLKKVLKTGECEDEFVESITMYN